MNPVLRAPLQPRCGCLSQPARTTSSCANLKFHSSGRELRTEMRMFFAAELLAPALPNWVSLEGTASLAKPQPFQWIHRGCHIFGLTSTMLVSGLSSNKEAQRCFSAVAASLSSTLPEEDSVSGSPEEHGLKIDLNLPRRRLQLSFTCDACGARSQRLINPDAYDRGTVFVQCEGCEVYHKLVDNLGLIEEYDFRKEASSKADGADSNVLE